jgi:hypothetical protein
MMAIFGEDAVTRFRMLAEIERTDHPTDSYGQLVNRVFTNLAINEHHYDPIDEIYEQMKADKYAKHVLARSRGKLTGDTCKSCRLMIRSLDGEHSFCGLGGRPVEPDVDSCGDHSPK